MVALNEAHDLDALLDDIKDSTIVMLGEASHGTHEFYTWRTAISKRLIEEKGFRFIAVEGDWPDCYMINRYVKGYADAGEDIADVLKKFDRWPAWMWANWETAALAEWLKSYNNHLSIANQIGFYGLDVYSLWDSMKAVLDYLQKEDPAVLNVVKKAFRCFEPFGEDEREYARFTNDAYNCSEELIALLHEVRLKSQFLNGDREAGFNTTQNALIAVNAEKYYRTMMEFNNESWNIRDEHMIETLDGLLQFHGDKAKAIVWAHNTHIGDARATPMHDAGMVNLGQLAREKYGLAKVYLVGFSSYEGTVLAGEDWGAPMQEMQVPGAREGSVENFLHEKGKNHYWLLRHDVNPVFQSPLPHRAIGVVYRPGREKYGNYVPSLIAQRYDALVFLDETKALHPLALHHDRHKLPGTWPFNL